MKDLTQGVNVMDSQILEDEEVADKNNELISSRRTQCSLKQSKQQTWYHKFITSRKYKHMYSKCPQDPAKPK